MKLLYFGNSKTYGKFFKLIFEEKLGCSEFVLNEALFLFNVSHTPLQRETKLTETFCVELAETKLEEFKQSLDCVSTISTGSILTLATMLHQNSFF